MPRSFDALFLAELERQMAAGKVQERLVYDTDAGGVATGAWPWTWIPKAWIGAQLQLAPR